jgi:cold shock CspA family protein
MRRALFSAGAMPDETRYGGAIYSVVKSGDYGFIVLPDGGKVFIHRSELLNGYALEPGAQVVFSVTEMSKGLKAVDVELIGGPEDCVEAALAGPPGGG